MWYRFVLPLILAGGFAPAGRAQIAGGSIEMVTGQVAAVDASDRPEAVRLLDQARNQYALRGTRHAYDLKVAFTVKSGGSTELDGAWTMEDVFDPRQGLRWTARGPGGYTITRISKNGMLYGDDTTDYVPLRLQEARAALFDPMPSAESVNRASIRTSTVVRHGAALTCVLLSGSGNGLPTATGRRWDESEECIDPQSGLLQVHSQVSGRYYSYDYSNAVTLADRTLPRQVTVSEGGRAVSTIAVESLSELSTADAALFQPTDEMKAKGRPITLGGAQKVSRTLGPNPSGRTTAAQTVCVFGVVTPSGQLMEAHSLEPSNPNSAAAVEAVKQMSFAGLTPPGQQPQQYFVFVVGKFSAAP